MSATEVYKRTAEVLKEGHTAVLAHITTVSGSVPAGSLSKMLVSGEGNCFGTVGGGLVEAEAIEDALTVLTTGKMMSKLYVMSHDDISAGMICGGRIEVLFEYLRPEDAELFQAAADNSDGGIKCALTTLFEDGLVTEKYLVKPEDSDVPSKTFAEENISEFFEELWKQGKPGVKTDVNRTVLFDPLEEKCRLILFGGGHVSIAVAEIAVKCGFSVSVVDDRPEFVHQDRFPQGSQLLCRDIPEAFRHLDVKRNSYIVIVTRGHASDEVALEHALQTPAPYIGMIGSRKKVATLYSRLLERDSDRERLSEVFAPMGLDIGAETVEEIAVSIIAEMIKVRRLGGESPAGHLKQRVSRFFRK